MNTLLRKYRLFFTLATSVLVLAMQVHGASSAFARGVAPGGDTHAIADLNAPGACQNPPNPHDTCNWGGNEATSGAIGTYTEASANFRVPTITGNVGDEVAFWVGLGGDPRYVAHSSAQLFQAGIASYIDASGNQYNFAWYEFCSETSCPPPVHVHFDSGLEAGQMIDVKVDSNHHQGGTNHYTITNEATGEEHDKAVSGPLSDGITGECIGERPGHIGSQPPLADFGTEWINNCTIATNQTSQPVVDWSNTDWYRVVNASATLLEGIGALDQNGSFTLNWKQAA